MRRRMKKEWLNSIVVKFMLGFAVVILSTLGAHIFVYNEAYEMAQKITYEKLYSQAEYYLQSFDNDMNNVRLLQNEFFNDRKLVFVIDPSVNISEYEKRDCLLSVKERMDAIVGVSTLVQDGVVYLPKSGYRILSTGVRQMSEDDRAEMNDYLQYTDDQIHRDGDIFFIVKTGAPMVRKSVLPNHVFILRFSRDEIVKNMSVVNTSADSGAFWLSDSEGVWVEHSSGQCVGDKIALQLKKDEDGEYERVQRLEIDGKYYLVFVGGRSELGMFVQYETEESAMRLVFDFRTLALITLFALTVLAVLIGVYSLIMLHKPINVLLSGFRRVQSGDWKQHITDERRDEFSYLYKGFNEMEDQIDRLINEVYVQTNLTQRAQMKQLQAQIAPHFLYNSFFVLSRRIKRQDYENAELLAKHLGNYFQYLTRSEADYMPLRMEVEHARSYSAVQEARFSHRIRVDFEETPPAFGSVMVPRLTLQPLLENAFKYGLEDKIVDGLLLIRFVETESEWQICVEDNGENTTDERLKEISDALTNGKQGEITALYNIHMRLQNYYRGQSGIRVGRSALGGMEAVIYIGKEVAICEHEAADRG